MDLLNGRQVKKAVAIWAASIRPSGVMARMAALERRRPLRLSGMTIRMAVMVRLKALQLGKVIRDGTAMASSNGAGAVTASLIIQRKNTAIAAVFVAVAIGTVSRTVLRP